MVNNFSVIIPLFNGEAYIGRALDSILGQTLQKFEIIVVDDHSTDQGAQVVMAYAENDSRVRLIQHDRNLGVSVARNRGIQEASYQLIAFLDADDEWDPDYLETIQKLITNYPDCGAYASSYRIEYENGLVIDQSKRGAFREGWSGKIDDLFQMIIQTGGTPFHTDTIVVRKEVLERIGGFPVGMVRGQDVYTWIQIGMYDTICFINSPKATYYKGIPHQTTSLPEKSNMQAWEKIRHLYDSGQVPEKYRRSFLEYSSATLLSAVRRLILLNRDGKQARIILRKFGAKNSFQYFWLYFWSFFPKNFFCIVKLKEIIANKSVLG